MNISYDLSKGNIDGQLRWRENLKNHQNGIVATWSGISDENDMDRHSLRSGWHIFWIYVPIAQEMPLIHVQALDGSIAVRLSLKRCTVSWRNMMICRRYAHVRLRFFSRQMLELGETTLQLFRGILPAILKTNENQRLINDINQSIAQSILRTFCTYLSINRSIDRAILNLSEELHIFIVLGIVAIGLF